MHCMYLYVSLQLCMISRQGQPTMSKPHQHARPAPFWQWDTGPPAIRAATCQFPGATKTRDADTVPDKMFLALQRWDRSPNGLRGMLTMPTFVICRASSQRSTGLRPAGRVIVTVAPEDFRDRESTKTSAFFEIRNAFSFAGLGGLFPLSNCFRWRFFVVIDNSLTLRESHVPFIRRPMVKDCAGICLRRRVQAHGSARATRGRQR